MVRPVVGLVVLERFNQIQPGKKFILLYTSTSQWNDIQWLTGVWGSKYLHGTETRLKMAYKSQLYLSIVDCRQLPGKYIDLEEMRLLATRGKLQGQKGRETFMYRKVQDYQLIMDTFYL